MLDFIAFDLEVLNSPTAPGFSWGRPEDLGISVACTWSRTDGYHDWFAPDAGALLAYLAFSAGNIVTWNGAAFDYSVLDGAVNRSRGSTLRLLAHRSVDLMLIAQDALGHRVKLDSAARGTLRRGKTGHGAHAPQQWAAGQTQAVIDYCRDDVALTMDLYLAGLSGRRLRAPRPGKPDDEWMSPPTTVPNLSVGRALLARY